MPQRDKMPQHGEFNKQSIELSVFCNSNKTGSAVVDGECNSVLVEVRVEGRRRFMR
jgi:hypothetical protein